MGNQHRISSGKMASHGRDPHAGAGAEGDHKGAAEMNSYGLTATPTPYSPFPCAARDWRGDGGVGGGGKTHRREWMGGRYLGVFTLLALVSHCSSLPVISNKLH